MIDIILIGSLLIFLSIIIHSAVTMLTYQLIYNKHHGDSKLKRVIYIDLIVIAIMTATIAEGVLWAISYSSIGAFKTFEEAMYFSLVTYTTLGYGDLVLQDSHRLMGAIEAANGVIMFGWSTSIVVFVIQKIYFKS